MKIAILLPQVARNASGGHKVIFEYANKLVEYGHTVSVYYFYGISFQSYHLPEFIRRFLVRKYVKYIGSSNWFDLDTRISENVIDDVELPSDIDIVIATSIETAIKLNESKINYKKVYFIQDFENWNYTDKEVTDTYRYGMTNIVVSNWLKRIVESHSNNNVNVVSNCINTDVFYDKHKKRKKHSIVFHYRSAAYKGSTYAIKVIEKLEKIYPDLSVSVISVESKPDYLPQSCTFFHALSPDEISDINNETEIFMCTSIEEGFGLPGLEAMACGCALVSSSYRGVLEYAVNGQNALLSDAKDVESMVKNIVKLFDDNDLMNSIISKGIATGQSRSLDRAAREFEKFLLSN